VIPAPKPISGLGALDRSLLYVFVAGPGVGEAVAVALPERDWVLIDTCEVAGQPVLAALLRRFCKNDEAVRALVLTHPHEDHARGFAKIVEEFRPERLVVTAKHPEGTHLLFCALAWLREIERSTSHEELRGRAVLSALKAMERWESEHPGKILNGIDGLEIPLAGSRAHITVRAPHSCAHLDGLLDALAKGQRDHVNEASLVLELEFGTTRVVFGGDLPTFRGRWSVPTGWSSTMARHRELGSHQGLKIPHHGSAQAFHADLMSRSQDAVWLVSPYDPSRLPRAFDADGLPRLLEGNGRVSVTQLMAACMTANGVSLPTVPLSSLEKRTRREPTGDAFADSSEDIRPRAAASPFDPLWVIAFDERSGCQGRWYGSHALEVVA
jgi:glyoxylase-like metal-dependent hydrolase (beta-lactamase superfamily II)